MSTINSVSDMETTNEEVFDNSVEKVLLRSVLSSVQIKEVESRQKQPTMVLTELHGKPNGYYALDDRVDPSTRAMLDENQKMILIAPVAGG